MLNKHVTVINRVATYLKRDGAIVCNNSGYKISFAFDSEWDAYATKTARFIWNGAYRDVEFTGNECAVPPIFNASEVHVGVYVDDIQTTTSAVIPCLKSVKCETGAAQSKPNGGTPSANLIEKSFTVTESSTFEASTFGADGFSKVTINVQKSESLPAGVFSITGNYLIENNGKTISLADLIARGYGSIYIALEEAGNDGEA